MGFIEWAMTMVKLPNLEFKEVEQLVEALEHYCAALRCAQSKDTSEYVGLTKMLKLRLKPDLSVTILTE
jgi:hypothetical protein